jgi:hypothetical protein
MNAPHHGAERKNYEVQKTSVSTPVHPVAICFYRPIVWWVHTFGDPQMILGASRIPRSRWRILGTMDHGFRQYECNDVVAVSM